MPRDLIQENCNEEHPFDADAFRNLFDASSKSSAPANVPDVNDRFGRLFEIYGGYMEDDYEDWEVTRSRGRPEICENLEAQILQQAHDSFVRPDVSSDERVWNRALDWMKTVFRRRVEFA